MRNLSLCFFPPDTLDNLRDSPGIKANCLSLKEMETANFTLGTEEWEIIEDVGLTNRQIQCIWLYYYQDLTHQSIADLLGVQRPVVTIYLKRARGRIASYFGRSAEG